MHKKEEVRCVPREGLKSGKGSADPGPDPLLETKRRKFSTKIKVSMSKSSETEIVTRRSRITATSSPVMLLSFYDLLISGFEYRHKGFFFWVSKASLLGYFYFIRYLHFLPLSISFSFYYPGPPFFLLPTYKNSTNSVSYTHLTLPTIYSV